MFSNLKRMFTAKHKYADLSEEQELLENPDLNIDETITLLGGLGPFQLLLDASLGIALLPGAFQVLMLYFTSVDPDWRCVANSTVCVYNTTLSSHNNARCSMPRSEWEYTVPSDFSLATEFELQCGKKWMLNLLIAVIFIGWGIGAPVLGMLADRYGRKIILYISYAMILLFSFITPFASNYILMVICRFTIGFFIPGAMVQATILVCEYVGPKHRAPTNIFLGLMFSVALCLLVLQAYFIRRWKTLMIVCSAPYFVCVFTYRFVPESVRWLRLKGKVNEMMNIFERVANWNRKVVPPNLNIISPPDTQHKASPFELIRTRKMMVRTIAQGYVWLGTGMVYYSLYIAADDLGGSIYLDFFLLTIIGIPATLWSIDLCERIGRKKTCFCAMFIASASCAAVAFTPTVGKIKHLRLFFAMCGKFFMEMVFSVIYVWAVELYPTNIRSNGMGFLQVTSRIGSASAPFVAKGLQAIHKSTPYVTMAAVSLVASGVILLLPETRGLPTLETVEDVELRTTSELIEEVVVEDDDVE